MRIIISYITFVLVLLTQWGNAQSTGFIITDSLEDISLGKQIEILEDKTGNLTIEDIISPEIQEKFVRSGKDEPGFGFTNSAYWAKLQVVNPLDHEVEWYLEIGYPLVDSVDFFRPESNGIFSVTKTGDRLAYQTREYDYRNFIFSLKERPGSTTTYYLRFKTGSSMNFPMHFWTKKALLEKISHGQALIGIFFGAIIIMVIYNFFLFIGFRDWSYLYLLLFIISWALAQLAIDGLAYQYIWTDWNWWANANIPFFIFTTILASTQFCRSLLMTRKFIPIADRILRIENVIYAAGMAFSLVIPYAIMIKIGTALAILTVFSVGYAGIISLKLGNRTAFYFITAWGAFLIGVILFSFKTFGVLASNDLTNWSIHIGFFALIMLFSLAVQDRINTEKKEKFKVQEKLVDTLKQSEKMLEEKVEERTRELNTKNALLDFRAKELTNINKLTEKVNSTLNFQEVLQFISIEMVKFFPVRNAGIGLINVEKKTLQIVAFHSSNPGEDDAKGMELSMTDYDAIQYVMQTKMTLAIKNAQTDPRTVSIHNLMKLRGTKSFLIVPIISLNKVIGTIGMPATDPDYIFSSEEIEFARTIATQVASAVENARLYSQTEKARVIAEQDLEIGRQIQTGFFPETLPLIPGWEFAAHFKAARQVAGDFYDIFKLGKSNYTGFVVADVCDKGVGAALFMVLFRSLIRAFSEFDIPNVKRQLKEIILNTNNYISKTHGSSNMFASIFFGILDSDNGALYYINAGLDPPVITDKDGKIINRLLPTGPVVGMLPDMDFTVEMVHLNKGDVFFSYTDGSTDLRNIDLRTYSEEALMELLGSSSVSALSLLFKIDEELKQFMGEQDQYDDITQIAIRRKLSEDDHLHEAERLAVHENLEELRDFVEKAAIRSGLSKENIHAFKLSAEEILVNIIDHGYQGMEPGLIKIHFNITEDNAFLRISDFGKFFAPSQSAAPETEASWKDREIGGLGLFLVKELMDKIDYKKANDNSNQLTLVKKINSM